MGIGPPASASRGDFRAARRRSSPDRAGARLPKVALGPLAVAIVLLLVWSSRSREGTSGTPKTVSVVPGEARSSVSEALEDARLFPDAGVVVEDGRRVFKPFERVRRGGRVSKAEFIESPETGAFAFGRVRQVIDDSHLPSLPPLPPDAPPQPDVPDARDGFDLQTDARAGNGDSSAKTKSVRGGLFVWTKSPRSSGAT